VTVVPLPDTPCVRVRLIGEDPAANDWGTRFYLSYAGSAPTGANCTTLANDILAAWTADLESYLSENATINEIDVLDIATNTGLSGQFVGSQVGTRVGTSLAAQIAVNVEYGIARRYRGGKPRGYWPFGVDEDMQSVATWHPAFITALNASMLAFFTAVEALSVGAMGALKHVNLSYYSGFTNHANTSGRERAVPTYRATALHDNVTGYFTKAELSSQRRRRTATTP